MRISVWSMEHGKTQELWYKVLEDMWNSMPEDISDDTSKPAFTAVGNRYKELIISEVEGGAKFKA
jgi:hypothetical protein